MQSMKTAIQHTVGHKPAVSKVKDGSAHPHAGSDKQVDNFIMFFQSITKYILI